MEFDLQDLKGLECIVDGLESKREAKEQELLQLKKNIQLLLQELGLAESEDQTLEHLLELKQKREHQVSSILNECESLQSNLGSNYDLNFDLRADVAESRLQIIQMETNKTLQQISLQQKDLEQLVIDFPWLKLQIPQRKSTLYAHLEDLSNTVQQAKSSIESRQQILDSLIAEITILHKHLGIQTPIERDLLRVEEYQELVQDLRLKNEEKLKLVMDQYIKKLERLWEKLKVSQEEQQEFLSQISIEKLENQVTILEARLEKTRDILQLIQDRATLLVKMEHFEQTASDPKRLFRPSFQLLEEEKFRKTCYPTLIKLEAELLSKLARYERNNGVLVINGQGITKLLQHEIQNRFINESVFMLAASKHKKR